MERVSTLIHSLKTKSESGAHPGELLSLVDELRRELTRAQPAKDHTATQVSVWLPSGYNKVNTVIEEAPATNSSEIRNGQTAEPAVEPVAEIVKPVVEDIVNPILPNHNNYLPKAEIVNNHPLPVAPQDLELKESFPTHHFEERKGAEPIEEKPELKATGLQDDISAFLGITPNLSVPRPPQILMEEMAAEEEKAVPPLPIFLDESRIEIPTQVAQPEEIPTMRGFEPEEKEEPAPRDNSLLLELELPGEIFPGIKADKLTRGREIPPETMDEIDTVQVQTVSRPKELHEILASRVVAQPQKPEMPSRILAEALGGGKIGDLKKSIGINDRFRFIKSLFRGDETLFDRSVKTINNFNVMQEAQYWMQRELVIKLGWNEEDELVQEFYNLVKRRFL